MADWKEQYLQLWQKISKKQKYLIGGVTALVILLIIGGSYFYGGRPDMVPLFTNMEAKDAGEVAAKLKEAKIDYKVQESRLGTTILVPTKNVHDARLDLATQGLPRGSKGFELFDDSKLGVTEFQNKVNYLQALQGELTRTIEQIGAVEKARVHIVLPEDSLYKKNEKPATASIMLKLRPDVKLAKKEIKGIVNLAAHSIQGLAPENITIVDDRGRILNDPEDEEEKTKDGVDKQTVTQIDMTRKVQERMQKDVQLLLDQALGQGKAYVSVHVELDFDQKQTDRQIFTPVVDDSGIIRSQQDVSESYNGTSTNPGGPAGITSNVPGYVAQNGNTNAEYEKKESTKNYEINEEKQKVVASPGSIRRVNIAVLVNDQLTRDQQASIMRAVSSAVGINAERGDTVSVEPLPFSTEIADKKAAEEQKEIDRQNRTFYTIVGLSLLVIALIVGAVLMHRRKKRLEAEAAAAALAEQQRLEEEEMRRLEALRAAAVESGEVVAEELTEEEKRTISEREEIERLINTTPGEVALLVKTWLSEE